MIADQHFATSGRSISNLDRCNLCGRPRAVHGIDWTCSPGPPGGSSPVRSIALTIGGGLLALAGIGWLAVTSRTATAAGSLAATALLCGLTLLVCGTIVIGLRRRG